ncbi:heat-inducible transcriptional repressor HrcA [Alphaproteobacteria bacterium]|nr:heat-inducible transcriptional repressor HrcA [Alphaproteobacteria bacterium]
MINKFKNETGIGIRAKVILAEVVEAYLNNGHPVSSKIISEKLNPLLSSSSIRLVMSKLEEQGYLYAPYTSAGRMPTDRGLKLFVDGLLEIGDLTKDERKNIESRCAVAGKTLLEVLDHSSKELAGLSNCTSMVFAPNNLDRPLKHIEFVSLDYEKALVITIDLNGLVENKLIKIPKGITNSALLEATNYINSKIYGKNLSEVKKAINKELEKQSSEIEKLSEQLVSEGIAIRSKDKGEEHFLINRRDLIYGKVDQKEELTRLNNLLNELQNKENFINILKHTSEGTGVHVFIGSNTEMFNLSGCSMIVAPLKQRPKDKNVNTLGAIGVIGPSRLNYSRVIPMVDFTAKVLNKFLN